jgi:hypothetical protein
VEYRGIRYAVRTSIVRRKWRVAVYINENEPVERTVTGSRLDAERVAQVMIDRLLDLPKQTR